MQVKRLINVLSILVVSSHFFQSASGQQVNKQLGKTVCTSHAPSRHSLVSSKKKLTKKVPVKNELSCCKGTPSRFTALHPGNAKHITPVVKN